MTEDQQIRLIKRHQELMAEIKPIEDQLKPLAEERHFIERMILEDLKQEWTSRQCGEWMISMPECA